ncbi:glycoside hydrolase family 18 protein [Auriculariales sp. MPI-PUGE-AT-0066]|nr:glycoside hydrolase family 18 protein [Auriculariales sp. MPI-PUGE-AT-0066]
MSLAGHRVAAYYQTQYDWGHNASYVSPLPLIGLATHIYLAAYHLNSNKPIGQSVTLNDNPPSAVPYYERMWQEIKQTQDAGIKIVGMLGGAAAGTFSLLTPANWNTYYPDLRAAIADYNLDGVDIDVEQSTSISVIIRLITQLKADFGPDFIITLAPVASALQEGSNLSGFNYVTLESQVGSNISWYNAQFYSGFGHFFPDDQYISIVQHANGIFPPGKVVASVLTAPELGSGYTSVTSVVQSIKDLVAVYGDQFGGIAGWEYFASLPGGWTAPWQWAQTMKDALESQAKNPSRETRDAALKRIMDRAAKRVTDAKAAGIDLTDLKNRPLSGPLRKETRPGQLN